MELLDGKEISQEILEDISKEINNLKREGLRAPRLDMILVGEDFGSVKYVGMKEKTAREVGILGKTHHLSENINTMALIDLVDSLNKDVEVDGFMIQLPLPSHINVNLVLEAINPRKDVDGLTPTNLGKLFQKDPSSIAPATALGIMELLSAYRIKIFGKNVVILGASNIVGKPLSALMLEKNATVTLCNEYTIDVKSITKDADILVSATGKPHLIKGDFLKKDCVLIDVGSSKDPQTGKLVGDVDTESVRGIPSYITPVPGGVGPMTIACLMHNLLTCYKNRTSI